MLCLKDGPVLENKRSHWFTDLPLQCAIKLSSVLLKSGLLTVDTIKLSLQTRMFDNLNQLWLFQKVYVLLKYSPVLVCC